ncbi:MAG: hypothetical protein KAU95_01065 [Candidatus Aenigmarchaeota archaeon]|nr:hypothetical protein [Candidatus Aenigmarchaeota archaeon]
MKENVYVLAHGVDVDGISSHAIADRYFSSKGKNIIHKYVTYQNFREALKEVAKDSPGTEIVIADIGYNKNYDKEDELGVYELLENLSENNTIKWFDHHNWPKDKKEKYEKLLSVLKVDKNKCGAELVCNYYMKEDDFAVELSQVAHIHDFGDSSDSEKLLGYKLQDVISGCAEKDDVVDTLSNGTLWNDDFENIYENYQQTKKEAFEILDLRTEHYVAEDNKFVMSYVPDALDSKPVRKHIQESYEADMFIGVWENGRIAWEAKNKELEPVLDTLKEKFSGGGRGLAGGGTYKDEEITEDNYQEILKKILESIQNK